MAAENPLGAVVAGIAVFVAGLAIGVWAIEQARSESDRLAIASRVEGTVTGELNGHPVVSFSLPDGDRVSFTAAGVRLADYPAGTRLQVLYRPDRPGDAVVDRPRARWLRSGLLGALAVAAMALGAYVSWYARNYEARRAS